MIACADFLQKKTESPQNILEITIYLVSFPTRTKPPTRHNLFENSLIVCMCIYIYMVVGSFATANFAVFGVFPQIYSKKWPKRDVANLPHLSIYVFDKNSPEMAGDCSPKHFFEKEGHWDCNPRPFSWFIWVSKLIFCLFGKKTLQIAEMLNIPNLSFPKKAKICGGKRAHRLYGWCVRKWGAFCVLIVR